MSYQAATAPLTIGESLDSGFALFKSSFRSVWPFALVSAIAGIPLNSFDDSAFVSDSGVADLGAFGLYVFLGLGYLFVGLVMFCTMTMQMRAVHEGTVLPAGAALRAGLGRTPMSLLAGFMFFLFFFISIFVPLVMTVLFWGFALLFIPVCWVLVTVCFVFHGIVLERMNPVSATGYSFALVRRRWWRTAAQITVIGIIGSVVYIFLGFLVGLFVAMGNADVETIDNIMRIFAIFVAPILAVFLTPLYLALFAALYFDTKVRLLGSDLAARIDALTA